MKLRRLHITGSIGILCLGMALASVIGLMECEATDPVLGETNTTATGAAGMPGRRLGVQDGKTPASK